MSTTDLKPIESQNALSAPDREALVAVRAERALVSGAVRLAAYRRAMSTPIDRSAAFRALHESGTFVMPNPWDAGSARYLASLGFPALASTSAGFAWTLGRADGQVTLDEVIGHLETLVAAVDLPVNADFENGFANDPEGVAHNVRRAAATGVAGLSIEDSTKDGSEPLYAFELAVDRIRAAREALDGVGSGVVLTARSEGFIRGRPDLEETVRRLRAYADAGADCLYAPGISTREQIETIVQAVAPKPINVLIWAGFLPLDALRELGVRRLSTGGGLAANAWGGAMQAASALAGGSFEGLRGAAKSADIVASFGG
jgi:2-methylisocitrate lyase-like PEP mutase family enzyme